MTKASGTKADLAMRAKLREAFQRHFTRDFTTEQTRTCERWIKGADPYLAFRLLRYDLVKTPRSRMVVSNPVPPDPKAVGGNVLRAIGSMVDFVDAEDDPEYKPPPWMRCTLQVSTSPDHLYMHTDISFGSVASHSPRDTLRYAAAMSDGASWCFDALYAMETAGLEIGIPSYIQDDSSATGMHITYSRGELAPTMPAKRKTPG